MKYRAVFFDLDGTVLDTIEDLNNATNFALEKNGLEKISIDDTKNALGDGIHKLIERVCKIDSKVEVVYNDCLSYYNEHLHDASKVYDGIYDLLVYLKKNNISTAIISNKVNLAVQELFNHFFEGIVDMAVGVNDSFKSKPDVRMPRFCEFAVSVSKEEVLYVGDTGVDILTAKNAGYDMVAVSWGFRTKEELLKIDPNLKIIDKPAELIDYLK